MIALVQKQVIKPNYTIINSNHRNDDDFYETPLWAIWCLFQNWNPPEYAFETCVGDGSIVKASQYYGKNLFAYTNDINKKHKADFHLNAVRKKNWNYWESYMSDQGKPILCVITNPPYGNLAPKILENSLIYSRCAVAMFLRNTFIEPCVNRSFMRYFPVNMIISMPRYSFKNTDTSDSDMTACSWYVFDKRMGSNQKIIQVFQDEIPDYFRTPKKGKKLGLIV